MCDGRVEEFPVVQKWICARGNDIDKITICKHKHLCNDISIRNSVIFRAICDDPLDMENDIEELDLISKTVARTIKKFETNDID